MGQRHAPRREPSAQRVLDAPGRVRLDYLDTTDLPRWLATANESPLAVVSFGTPIPSSPPCPVLTLDLPELNGRAQLEVWSSDQPATVHRMGDLTATTSGDLLFGTLQVEETPNGGLRRATETAYRQLLQHLRTLGFPYLWRVWNFFPGINEEDQGLERYRQFCVGRHQALAEALSGFPASLPAGTAVGTRSGPLQLYVLAGIHPALHLGNPRQVHAYEYPDEYGPCSPSFARATLARTERGSQLFIAGTASVVGHESRHRGNPDAQVRETAENLRALIAHAGAVAEPLAGNPAPAGLYKVYVRHPEHLTAIQQALNIPFFAESRLLYLQGDLCRRELLVEIEGLLTTD
ncbi:MAG: hypothetical protein U0412_09880 [Nitrospira sp.]